ncbi:hypothetical protein BU25DRAFT_252944 [Macroventuria anomochaeta]|uniref:Uncharacterized protein n=1 Tax=Macroventuria anomochaeta TaxID=301207 RepID=A0ACB6RJ64_9PLEO|nr:uncharacterized protein BU25DRAFT_252944 [Macroventuria anomochaeta]KAF2621143.1 hypothetical protein BU25DRAFT_252944 [Macroventuria anomochaeta]
MGHVLHLDLPLGPANLLGISAASGLNGPGAWAFWIMTVFLSWTHIGISTYLSDFYVSSLLYTNWTAADLLYQLPCLDTPFAHGVSLRGSVAASFTITYWGFYHASLQLLVCFVYGRRSTLPPAHGQPGGDEL